MKTGKTGDPAADSLPARPVRLSGGLYRDLLEAAPDAMIVVAENGRIVLANSQAERLYGYTAEELLDQPVEMLLVDHTRAAHAGQRMSYFSKPHARPMGAGMELRGRRKDGSTFPAEVSLSPVQTDGGLLVSSAIRDVTERKRSEEALARLAAIVESAYDAIFSTDLRGNILTWNPAAHRMFGYSAQEIIGRNISILTPAGREDDTRTILGRIRRGERAPPYETVRRRKDGSLIEIWLTSSPLEDPHGRVIGAAKIARDLTERKEMEQKLREEAQQDELTGAATRRHFRELAQRELARVRRHGGSLSVVAIDVDRFKNINDSHGHAVGDRVLQALSHACGEILREEDVVGRLGGDEFVLLLPETDGAAAAKVAERLLATIARLPVRGAESADVQFTASIGVAASTSEDVGIDQLLRRADEALYAAKRAGRNTVRLNTPDL